MIVLYFGDIFAKAGRQVVTAFMPALKKRYRPDFIIGNVENLAAGRGVTRKTLDELWKLGFSGFTSGNHIWDNKEVHSVFESEPRVIRPANYPPKTPGSGYVCLESDAYQLGLVNLMGRVFMDSIDCPFQAADRVLKQIPKGIPTFVDFHAETTSESYAMGWFLDGRVSAMVGTHTHVQTADNRILRKGTAYISDVGMCGSFDSVIGMSREEVVKKFATKLPHRYQPATENPGVSCVVIEIQPDGRSSRILRIRQSQSEFNQYQGEDWP